MLKAKMGKGGTGGRKKNSVAFIEQQKKPTLEEVENGKSKKKGDAWYP